MHRAVQTAEEKLVSTQKNKEDLTSEGLKKLLL